MKSIQRLALLSGSILGLLAVIFGAFGAHLLEDRLSSDSLDAYETAVRFQMYHSLLLLLVGLMAIHFSHPFLKRAALFLISGIILFSGSIYLLVLGEVPVGILTPIGGFLLIVGWVFLLFACIQATQGEQ